MLEQIVSLMLFAAFMVSTPGPANLVLISSGAGYGLAGSWRFLLGIMGGKVVMNAGMAFGFYKLMQLYPWLLPTLSYISAAYMIWLSIKLGRRPLVSTGASLAAPPRFVEGLIVHPLNPKAWAMTTIAVADFGPLFDSGVERFLVIAGVFAANQLVFHTLWCLAGEKLMQAIADERRQNIVQKGMAAITVVVVLWVVLR